MLPTHATSGIGIEEVLDLIEQGLPSPADVALPRVFRTNGGDFGAVACDPAGPLVAEVVRTATDPFVGRQSLVRVFSGTLRPDDPVHVSGHLQQFARGPARRPRRPRRRPRPGRVPWPPRGRGVPAQVRRRSPATSCSSSRLAGAETTDTLSSPARPALVEPWVLPEPLLPVAIHARSKGDEDKLATVLQTLVSEDVTMRLDLNPETHQVVLWTMGPAHVALLTRSLEERHHLRGRGRAAADGAARDLRAARATRRGGRSSSPVVTASTPCAGCASSRCPAAPASSSSTRSSVARCRASTSPRSRRACGRSSTRGCSPATPPSTSGSRCVDGKAHSVDSSDMAFQTAAGLALREAANESTVAMLEPIDAVDIDVADESVGSTLADLRGRRGQVHGTEPVGARGAHRHPRRDAGAGAVPLPDRPALGLARHGHVHAALRPLRLPAAAARQGRRPRQLTRV